ncbi:MAG: hypothetical protein QXM08_03075 [Thermofilaceae archaeon]
MSVRTLSRIEVVDPRNPEKPVASFTVPGEVEKEQVRKSLRIGIVLKVSTGGRTRRKTFTVKVLDEDLERRIKAYVDSLTVRVTTIVSEESKSKEFTLSDVELERE